MLPKCALWVCYRLVFCLKKCSQLKKIINSQPCLSAIQYELSESRENKSYKFYLKYSFVMKKSCIMGKESLQ